MAEPAYAAARIVAERTCRHFAGHIAAERARGVTGLASPPGRPAIEAMIDCAFWASLRREEGYIPKISLAFLSPGETRHPLIFEQRLPVTVDVLTKLAPAVERPGIHLGVWRENEAFHVWGVTRALPKLCFVLEMIGPGLLVVKHRGIQEAGKFVNVAVLEGDQVKVLDMSLASLGAYPSLVASLLGIEEPGVPAGSMNVLIQLAVSMRAHEHGGTMLVVPQGSQLWRESMVGPMKYSVSPPYSELADLIRDPSVGRRRRRWQDALRRAVDAVAGLTAVDGATVLTDQCDLLAFGAKIGRRDGYARIEQVVDIEPIEGAVPNVIHPAQLGGMRHLSAAQFGQDQTDSLALVASQDGRFTVFAWSGVSGSLHAYRVEALLL